MRNRATLKWAIKCRDSVIANVDFIHTQTRTEGSLYRSAVRHIQFLGGFLVRINDSAIASKLKFWSTEIVSQSYIRTRVATQELKKVGIWCVYEGTYDEALAYLRAVLENAKQTVYVERFRFRTADGTLTPTNRQKKKGKFSVNWVTFTK